MLTVEIAYGRYNVRSDRDFKGLDQGGREGTAV
jgi:hypothetical protein